MKIGILGGTFDPVHLGHLAVAEEARAKLKLDEVIFMPVGQPWMKAGTRISPAEHRIAMLRLAIEGKPYFKLSTIEIERQGPTYTVDTLEELRKQSPEDELFFILGWSALSELHKWHEPQRLIKLCALVAVPRPGYQRPDLKALEVTIHGISHRVKLLDRPFMDISATEIRDRVACGLPIGYLVPKAVEKYIWEYKLYIEEEEGSS